MNLRKVKMIKGAVVLSVVGAAALVAAVGFGMSSGTGSAPVAGKVGVNPGNVERAVPGHLVAKNGDQLAAFSGGCFWGTEDIFRQVKGVVATAVGYTGGHKVNPSYEEVCTHTTGHAETVLVEFDPSKVSYKQLLSTFWENHDPTTVDRQGPDIGDSYRSAIWFFSPEQEKQARESLVAQQKKLTHKIVTQIQAVKPFYLAEDYHQQYDEKHGTHFCPIGHGS